MKQADKSDKSHLTFGSSTSDDEKIIKVVDHGMKTAASRHANNSVEKILRKRKRKGIAVYFVKWKGYPDKFNSWIAESNISKL